VLQKEDEYVEMLTFGKYREISEKLGSLGYTIAIKD